VGSDSNLPDIVTWFSLIAGTITLIAGATIAFIETLRRKEVADKAKQAADDAIAKAGQEQNDQTVKEQGALSDALDSVAKLATSLKDLDTGTRVMVLGIALYAIAGVAAGLDAVAAAVASS
jgi:hypothetical protein